MNQKTVGLTLRALIIALALILAAGTGLTPLDGVAYAQLAGPTLTVAPPPPGSTSVTLSWNAIDGATGYQVVKQDTSVGTWSDEIEVSGTTYTDTDVMAGKTYGYYVRAVEGDTEGTWSNYRSVEIPGGTSAPTTVRTLTVTPSGLTTMTLSWDADSAATHYDLRYWTGSMWDRIGGDLTTTTYEHTGLTSGETYFYIVRGVNAGGNGPWQSQPYPSGTLDATTTTPELTITHPERLRVELSWTQVSAGATYQVQRMRVVTIDGVVSDTAAQAWANLGDAESDNTHTDTTVENASPDGDDDATNDSTVYHYRVQATENGVQGDYSNVKMVTIPPTDALPPTPTGLAATAVSSSRINVTWAGATGATSYHLRYKMGDGEYGEPMDMKAKLAYLHTGLSAATEYSYQVRAVNVNGRSDWSAAKSATTVAATTAAGRLGTPTGLRVVEATKAATDTEEAVPGLKVTWNAVAKATNYVLARWSGTAWSEVELTADEQKKRSKTDAAATGDLDALAAGMTYDYIVRAVDNNGTPDDADDDDMSEWSAPESGTTKAVKPDAAPEDLTLTPRGENRIWVSWTGIDGITDYVLQSRRKGSSTWSTVNVMGRTTHAHTGLSAGVQYQYRIAAKNSGGMSPWSAEASGTTWARQLATPQNLMAVDATTDADPAVPQIKLTWNKVAGATGYEIQKWSATNSAWRDLAGEEGSTPAASGKTTHTDTGDGVTAGMTYYYIVRATSGDVKSSWTDDVAGMTKATAPDAPTLHLAPVGQTMVRLTWAAASDDTTSKTGWEVEYYEGDLDVFTTHTKQMSLPALSVTPMYHTHRNLKPGTRYSYRIRGTLGQGVTTAWSEVGQIITKPANPSLKASSVTSTSIKLEWTLTKPAGLGETDADGFDCGEYEIQRRKTGVNTWAAVDDDPTLTGTKCAITDDGAADDTDGLDKNTLYYYRLRVATTPTDPADHPEIKSYWNMANARTPSQ